MFHSFTQTKLPESLCEDKRDKENRGIAAMLVAGLSLSTKED